MSKVAIVSGGTRGIGAAISLELKRKNYCVIANYVGNKERAEAFSQAHGIPVRAWDVGNYESCKNNLADIAQSFGPIQVLVNNAGITRDALFPKSTPEMWHEVMNTNLTACFNLSHCVFDAMKQQGQGRIINISSINGQKGQRGQVNYATAKAGILGFTKALALEGAPYGITVNAIAPGYVNTEMVQAVPQEILEKIIQQIPAKRLGLPEEVAHAVGFLVDDLSSFMNGATLTINGGQYMV